MKVLVINAGSSSLKYQLIDMDTKTLLAKGLCERIGIDGSKLTHKNIVKKTETVFEKPMKDHSDAIAMVIDALISPDCGVIASMDEIGAVGHRVVHGGETFADSCIIDDGVMDAIRACVPLAPLHNPANIIGIEACAKIIPGVKQVAVFDTAFHQTMPKEAYMYAIPYELYQKEKIRKYGFHGTSHKFVSQEAAKFIGRPIEDLKIITCHLGNGSSVAAVKYGKCIDTSMGFTPLDGIIMGTRCGAMDPAVVTYLIESCDMTAQEVDDMMNKKSGVLGVSGVSSDFRDISKAAEEGNERAALAIDMFAYRVKKLIGSYVAAMGGVDVVVFTGGIGENDARYRLKITEGLDCFGIKVDPERNDVRGVEKDISSDDAKAKTLVIPTNEELMIALDTQRLLGK
ncbi:MAG: acetate kinase [Firmicutes bacterium]|nr:acetate kinase [Bacillota bacterium]